MATEKRIPKYQYVRYLRRVLGDAIRRADGVVAPLKLGLEQGYRWEPDDTLNAMLAVDDLAETAQAVNKAVEAFAADRSNRWSKADLERLGHRPQGRRKAKGAIGDLAVGVRILDSIETTELNELQDLWQSEGTPVAEGHEAYFLKKFNQAMNFFRYAWTALFYVSQKPSRTRKIRLTARETKAFYNVMSTVRDQVREQAQSIADSEGSFVEVYDGDGDLIYVASPPSTLASAQRRAAKIAERQRAKARADWSHKPKKAAQGIRLSDATPAEAAAVLDILASRPGASLREAAIEVGVAVEEYTPPEQMSANPREDDLEDFVEMQAVWETVV